MYLTPQISENWKVFNNNANNQIRFPSVSVLEQSLSIYLSVAFKPVQTTTEPIWHYDTCFNRDIFMNSWNLSCR